jgi:hypothetical protein
VLIRNYKCLFFREIEVNCEVDIKLNVRVIDSQNVTFACNQNTSLHPHHLQQHLQQQHQQQHQQQQQQQRRRFSDPGPSEEIVI